MFPSVGHIIRLMLMRVSSAHSFVEAFRFFIVEYGVPNDNGLYLSLA